MKKNILVYILLLMIFIPNITYSADELFTKVDENNNLRLGNDYIVIIVNKDENGLGRFAIETTGGAPLRGNDNNKPLVYGRPKPWTSYSTLWINGENYVFGGFTGRRAGKKAKYGEIIDGPLIRDESIYTTTKFNNNLIVEQILTIVKSSTTGLYDTVQIKYRIENNSQEVQKVGLRIMLDTMLGENDGAPLRIGQDAVISDKLYYKKQLPIFWQAFDSISNPNVTSQGTFLGSNVTTPDKVYLADWGSLADGVWDFDFNPGEEFLRKGEYEIDSAIAMYWVPELLNPGETRSYITNYGLGGITIVPGLLSLGVTSPAEITYDKPDKTFPIIAYVENTSEIKAKNVKIKLNLPDSLIAENMQKNIGDLLPGGIAQIVWHVKSSGKKLPEDCQYQVKVEADNTDSNQVKRNIKFLGPPKLKTTVKLLDQLELIQGRIEPNPFQIGCEISNSGDSALYDVSVELQISPVFLLAAKEKYRKYTGDIKAEEKVNIIWQVKAGQIEENFDFPIAVDVRALNNYNDIKTFNLQLPNIKPYIYFSSKQETKFEKDDYITIDILGENISKVDRFQFNVLYNPEYLKPIYVSRGNFFLRDNKLLPWFKPNFSEQGVIRFTENIPTENISGILASIHFKVLKEGESELKFGNNVFYDKNNNNIEVKLQKYILK